MLANAMFILIGTIFSKSSLCVDLIPLATCSGVGLLCASYCNQCFPGGWCIQESDVNTGRCLCNYGWTGALSIYIKDTVDPGWGKNRITALNCNTPCHYTHALRNKTCAADPPKKLCNPTVCEINKHGKCVDGVCQCCKGWTGGYALYRNDYYYTDGVLFNCNISCPYLGLGVENPSCKPLPSPSLCNSKCIVNDGECDQKTGRCHCCEGWTGENAQFENDGRISVAGYCNVYCPYIKTSDANKRNWLCVNPDYIRRSIV
ncbi:multiple epidermal growth factor-like domains protein 11 [Hydra vulgaris]|uniref:Multiple epidermal growth factor-like domains protein 11 n=1 Tax=Hydra vulgaris TaxID=6087 RepID=A0ABM4B2Z2_HYDVU